MQYGALSEFLSASIGEEPNGMTLSLLSGLARLDVDPWAEAARLAEMPEAVAVAALAALLARALAATQAAAHADTRTLAASLVQLLPRKGSLAPETRTKPAGFAGILALRAGVSADALRWWAVAAAVALMLFTTFFY